MTVHLCELRFGEGLFGVSLDADFFGGLAGSLGDVLVFPPFTVPLSAFDEFCFCHT